MALDIGEIIRLTTNISSAGLGTANFGSAMFFCPESEMPAGEVVDTYKTYNLSSLTDAFNTTDETYIALANHWFTSAPSGPSTVKVWFVDSTDADWATTLNKARNKVWWYISLFDKDTYAEVTTSVLEIATWCLANESYFPNCQTGVSCTAIRDEGDDTDVASVLDATGNRFAHTIAHLTDPYAGIALMKWFARVNYSGIDTAITGNLKTTQGITSESLEASEYSAMNAKNVTYYTTVDSKGEEESGNWITNPTHSSYGEYPDDIFNVSAISNAVEVYAYNFLRGQTSKAPQTTKGQAGLIGAISQAGKQFFDNGYLGERQYTDPDDAQTKYTPTGFVMLSKAEDILSISSVDRAARKSAQVRYRLYPSGAIHSVEIEQTIYNQ
ncbi:hypothetical protein NVP1186O_41 [Vibrio phage 1.186.O._10N.286.49.E3]|nr:hypothetical protein NVP1186O_41 [Vibrio phage 1.186.O._10N.286.49.E3]